MSIHMIRGYVAPPRDGGALYNGVSGFSEYGYMYVTQEGEGSSVPDAAAFAPTQHWNEFGSHPRVEYVRMPGLDVPGPLGLLPPKSCGCQSCSCEPGGPATYGSYGEISTGTKVAIGLGIGYLLLGAGLFKAKSRRKSRRR